jgi:16S rRNA (cytosine967-C5)-methyltransferase
LSFRVTTRPATYARDGLVVTGGQFWRTPLADSGRLMVQDEASQLVAEVVAAGPGERILDACAAPGGKTLVLAAGALGGQVVACDTRAARVALVARVLRTHHAAHVPVVRADMTASPPFRDCFDAVLVDAPCSGLGTIRRDPDLKWRHNEGALKAMSERQLRLLTSAAAVVRAGGRLVYTTCSSEPEEDEEVVTRFLDADNRFTLMPRASLVARVPSEIGRFVETAGWFRTLPHRDGLEVFFGAVMTRSR